MHTKLVLIASLILCVACERLVPENHPPSVTWLEPATSGSFCAGDLIHFSASGTDPDGELPESAFTWANGATGLGTGREVTATFVEGDHTVSVTVFDGALSETEARGLEVRTCQPPVATITTPSADVTNTNSAYVITYDTTAMRWYFDATLAGTGVEDPNGGNLSGAQLQWTTNQTSLQPAALGSGTNLTARLYAPDCAGVTHTLTLTVTDSRGVTSTATRLLRIWTLC
jgi:hypothetical protein